MIVLGIALIIAGVLMMVRPNVVWTITESWKSNDATEPSNLYKWSTRFGGAMCTIVGVGVIIVLNL
jgi:uncharacterized membrane protein